MFYKLIFLCQVSPKEDEEEPEAGKSSPVRTEEPVTPAKRGRGKKAGAAAKQATPKKQTPKRKPGSVYFLSLNIHFIMFTNQWQSMPDICMVQHQTSHQLSKI